MNRSFPRGRPRRGSWVVALMLAGCLAGGFGLAPPIASVAHPSPDRSPSEAVGDSAPMPRVAASEPPPPGSVGNISIRIHNTALNPTGTYQQPVAVNSSRYSTLINANWSNGVAYYTVNDTPICAWIESGASNSSTETVIWLRLASLPGGGWTNVSFYFWPKTSFNLSENGYMGEAPELSSPYASLDNGWRVFDAYGNFSGTVLAPQWTAVGSWAGVVDDGLHVAASSGTGAIEGSLGGSFASNVTVEAYARMNASSAPLGLFMAESAGFSGEYQFFPDAVAMAAGYGGSQYAALQVSNSTGAWTYATPSTLAPVDFTEAFHVLGLRWLNSSSNDTASTNYLRIVSAVDATNASMTQMGLAGFCSTNCTSWDVSWIRSRNAPVPMPLVSNMGFPPIDVGVVASPLATDVGHLVSFACAAAGGSAPYNYSWTFGDSGRGTGRSTTHAYASAGTFTADCTAADSAGAMGSSTAVAVVNPTPAIILFQALPSSLQLGLELNLITNVSGGTPPLKFTFSGLPPGCPTRDSATLSCLPGETGTFAIEVVVTDAVGAQTSSFVTITVNPAPVQQNSTPFSPVEGYAIAGAVGGLVVLAGVLPLMWWSRRGPPGTPTESRAPGSGSGSTGNE